MKWKQYDIFLLLGCLFLFSCGIGWFHLGKKGQAVSLQTLVDVTQTVFSQSENNDDTVLALLTDEEILIYLKVLIASRSVERIVDNLRGLPAQKAVHIYELIAKQGTSALLSWDRKELLVLLAASFADRNDQDTILNVSQKWPEPEKDGSLLVPAAHLDGFKTLIPFVYDWYQRTYNATQLQNIIAKTYEHVIEKNSLEYFKRLIEQGVPIDKQLATRLLRKTVWDKKNPAFIGLLSQFNPVWNEHGADGITSLIKASRDSNYTMVEALLKAGADPNFIAKDEVGSALQNVLRLVLSKDSKRDAYEIHKLIEIELLLRKYGAKE